MTVVEDMAGAMADIKVVYGEEAGLAKLTRGFNRGFVDYKYGLHFTTAQMAGFLERSDIRLADCGVLMVREDGRWQGAGVALLAMDGDQAWCGGLAVAPEYRQRGLGRRLMLAIQKQARRRGATRLTLEVLSWNQPARLLYEQLGYRYRRELLIWERPASQGALPVPCERLQPTDVGRIIDEMYVWHDQSPGWERRAAYLRRRAAQIEGYTILARDQLPVAYALCKEGHDSQKDQDFVRILDVAVDPAADVSLAARSLLQALQLTYLDFDLLVINEPVDSQLNRVFAALAFYVLDRQYELCLELT